MRMLLANGNLVRLAASWGLWVSGEWAFLLSLSILAYNAAGLEAVGVAGAVRVLPAVVVAPWAASLADRYPRQRLLALIHLSWAVQLLLLALLASLGAPFAAICVVVALGALASAPFRPAVNALMPQLVERPAELTAVNAVYGAMEATGTFLGPLAAGGLLTLLAPRLVFVLIAVLYGMGAWASSGVHSAFRPAREHTAQPGRFSLLLSGFAALLEEPRARTIFAVFMAQTFMRGLLNVFLVSAAVEVLGLGESGVGTLFSAIGVGGLVGALLSFRVVTGRRMVPAFVAGVAAWGIAMLAVAAWPNPIAASLVLVGVGAGNAVEDIAGFALFQRVIPDHRQGRAFGAFWGTAGLSVALGSLVAPPLTAEAGLLGAMTISGSLMCLLVAAGWVRLRGLGDTSAPAAAVLALRHQPIFAPLPAIVVERLARALSPQTVHTGETIVRQGAPGDRFYVIEQGTFDVLVDGREIHHLGPGDAFGETALLRDTPRTATVLALTEGHLWWLAPDVFVPAVTGHWAASGAASGVIEDHLARARPTHGSSDT